MARKDGQACRGQVTRAGGAARPVVAGVAEAEPFWEQTVAALGRRWDLAAVEHWTVGGDGAPWVNAGRAHLPRATYRLDAYPLRRALRQGLGHAADAYAAACQAIAAGDWGGVEAALAAAARGRPARPRARVAALRGDLRAHWDGIVATDEAQTLGAIEGQVFPGVARRMKRHGARWSRRGTDHLGRLLAAQANGTLEAATRHAAPMQTARIRAAVRAASAPLRRRPGRADPGDWLPVHLPVLDSPHADRVWVKPVLRGLVHAGIEVA